MSKGKRKKQKLREAEINASRWEFARKRRQEEDQATSAVKRYTGHHTVSNWRRSQEYKTLAERAILLNGPSCSCCNEAAAGIFLTRFRGEDITGANMDHWRPVCEYHFHYIMSKSGALLPHNEIFNALYQAKSRKLSLV